jgi:hypothetical protein
MPNSSCILPFLAAITLAEIVVKARVEVYSTVNIHKCIVMRTEQTQTLIDETQYEAKVS